MNFIDYIEEKKLKEQFQTKLQYSNTLGTDGITVRKFIHILDNEIDLINKKVKNGTYKFSRYKEQLILKGKNKLPRVIQIPTHRDKLLLNALREFLVDNFKDKILDTSLHQKISSIKEHIKLNRYDSFIKVDVENFYPSISHEILIDKIAKVIDDKNSIDVLKKAISCDEIGIPQGLSISNILAAIYMSELDTTYNLKKELAYYRYVDDILILCNKSDIENIINSLSNEITNLKLTIHSFDTLNDKSVIGKIGIDSFGYLGHEFTNNTITVRKKSIEKLEKRILGVFHSCKNASDFELYKDLNLKISGCIYDNKQYGWLHFFGLIEDIELLHKLDWYVKKCFKQFKREYDDIKVKKFVKVYFQLKGLDVNKLSKNSYIPKFEGSNILNKSKYEVIKEFELDVDYYY